MAALDIRILLTPDCSLTWCLRLFSTFTETKMMSNEFCFSNLQLLGLGLYPEQSKRFYIFQEWCWVEWTWEQWSSPAPSWWESGSTLKQKYWIPMSSIMSLSGVRCQGSDLNLTALWPLGPLSFGTYFQNQINRLAFCHFLPLLVSLKPTEM